MKQLFAITICLLTIGWMGNGSAHAQQATATLDTGAIVIGEQVTLQLELQHSVNDSASWPLLADTLIKEVEIVAKSKLDTSYDSEDITTRILRQELVLTSFDSGYWAVPPFGFQVGETTVFTEPFLLEVTTIAVDTAQVIMDIKGPIEVEATFMDWLRANWHILAAVGGGLAVLALLVFFIKRKPQEEPKEIAPPPRPAHLVALENLDKLAEQKLWHKGQVKEYYTELLLILRIYLEQRFGIRAVEQTSEEIIHSLRTVGFDHVTKDRLQQILMLSDLVKFAKEAPLPNENEAAMENIREFIQLTARRETENPDSV